MGKVIGTRALDVICLGRIGVDLYAQQVGAPLEHAKSFAKYLGGSPANIAFGCARLGLRSGMLTRVGNDHMGRFLVDTLRGEGCDTSGVVVDSQRLTALVLLGIKNQQTFPLVFYRENCADMALSAQDIDPAYIASTRALLITGTHLSAPGVHAASLYALALARKFDVQRILDIDYRPALWGLAQRADGETRFVANQKVSRHLQSILEQFDLVVGTEEEFLIAGGNTDLLAALRQVREITQAVLVLKLGERGCVVLRGPVPDRLEDMEIQAGQQVEVLNVLGAGDAFMAGFLKGWLAGADDAECCRLANACGALVVSRHGCAPAMPSTVELTYYLERAKHLLRPDDDATLHRLHQVSVARREWRSLHIFAFDHRQQLIALAHELGADLARLGELKRLFVAAMEQVEWSLVEQGIEADIGILSDERFGRDALNDATGRGWWVGRPVELPGSRPLQLERGRLLQGELLEWPQEQVIKCLVQYHPDDEPVLRYEQEQLLLDIYQASQISGHELLLEVIPPRDHPSPCVSALYRAIERLYDIGIFPAWWKIEPQSRDAWACLDELIDTRDPYCRGVVLLGLNAPVEVLAEGFRQARGSRWCRGFAVGRTIFQAPSREWLSGGLSDDQLIQQVRETFERLVSSWRQAHASVCAREY